MLTLIERHEKCLYPCIRVRTPKALGSGTILFVEPSPQAPGLFDWYVLTNTHVVENLITIAPRWNSVLKREVKTDILGQPDVEVFTFAYVSRTVGSTGLQAEIVGYDKEQDLTLLRVRAPYSHPHVAKLIPEPEINDLVSFQGVWNVGCGMGAKPVITHGYLSAFGCEIENRDYYMVTAPSYFGNSGGATFLEESGHMIGVPARITVASLGFSADVVPHMGFSITATRIYEFLRDQSLDFVFDTNKTSVQCAAEREAKRAEDLKRRIGEDA